MYFLNANFFKSIPFLVFIGSCVLFWSASCQSQKQKSQKQKSQNTEQQKPYLVQKTAQEWQEILTENQYYILRKSGTERPFTGIYNHFYKDGIYQCAGCKQPLYASSNKFDSGTGWPSFDQPINNQALELHTDYNLGYARTELRCAQCGGHLGHRFNDGPKNTTGQRHCINSGALEFIAHKISNKN